MYLLGVVENVVRFALSHFGFFIILFSNQLKYNEIFMQSNPWGIRFVLLFFELLNVGKLIFLVARNAMKLLTRFAVSCLFV